MAVQRKPTIEEVLKASKVIESVKGDVGEITLKKLMQRMANEGVHLTDVSIKRIAEEMGLRIKRPQRPQGFMSEEFMKYPRTRELAKYILDLYEKLGEPVPDRLREISMWRPKEQTGE